jgi:hypothetical protein
MNEMAMSSIVERETIYAPRGMLTVHKYLPVAVLYFFLNSAGLTSGLFYTTMLSPFLFLWLFLEGKRWLTFKFLACLSPFIVAHALLGIDSSFYYARSAFLLWTTYITVYAFCWALLSCRNIDRLFEQIIVMNFAAAMTALVLMPTSLGDLLWIDDSKVNPGAAHNLRLKLFTLEPSVYAGLMAPLLIFAALRLFQKQGKRQALYLAMIAIPFLLCQSFGGLSMSLAGLGVALLVTFRHLFRQKRTLLILTLGIALVVVLLAIPNPISRRVMQVASGSDSSTNSRTILSFVVAYSVAAAKSLWWGTGLGQAKLVDVSSLGVGFTVGIIPNAVAGTFAELGIIGVLVRFGVEFYLFFRTRVFTNPFRLAMFVIAFISQLTGSYLMDVQEYLMWCFAFAPFFPAMNMQKGAVLKNGHA